MVLASHMVYMPRLQINFDIRRVYGGHGNTLLSVAKCFFFALIKMTPAAMQITSTTPIDLIYGVEIFFFIFFNKKDDGTLILLITHIYDGEMPYTKEA